MPLHKQDVSCLTLNKSTVQHNAYRRWMHKLALLDVLSDPVQGGLQPAHGYLLLYLVVRLAVMCDAIMV